MPVVTSYRPGMPAWIDLATSDPGGARAFYGELLGWTFDISPPESGSYTYCRVRGHNVAGMVGQPVENMPTGWTTYLATEDADETGRRMAAGGAALVLPPVEAGPAGRVVVARDPAGALIGAWQGREHKGAALLGEPGAVAWNELGTPDLDAATRFYCRLFDYTIDPVSTGGPPYLTLAVGAVPVAGVMEQPGTARWVPYIAVEAADAAAERAQSLGGTVRTDPVDSPYGRWIELADPQDGTFRAIELPQGASPLVP